MVVPVICCKKFVSSALRCWPVSMYSFVPAGMGNGDVIDCSMSYLATDSRRYFNGSISTVVSSR